MAQAGCSSMSDAAFLRCMQNQSLKLNENIRNGRSSQPKISPRNGKNSVRSSSARDAEEERKAQERALKLSADALAKWRKKAKEVTMRNCIRKQSLQ